MDRVTIEINGLRCYACHGVMEQERIVGNEFEVSVRLVYPAIDAVRDDDLARTVNYAEACDVIKHVMASPSALLENVCGRLKAALMARFPLVESGCVRVAKLCPPIPNVQLDSVAVELSW